MAWNPSPKVEDARQIARKWDRRQVVIIAIGDGQMEYASYGETPRECAEIKKLADIAYNAIYKTFQ